MRNQILFSLLALILAACADNPPGAGTEGHVCRNWPGTPCDEGLACEDGTCVSCGGPGEECCWHPGGSGYCTDPKYACDDGGDGSVCQNDCGLPGLPCCDSAFGDYCPIGECDPQSSMCEGTTSSSDACQGGSTPYSVWIVDGNCVALEVLFMVDTYAEAEACRQALVDVALPTEQICALGQEPEDTPVCKHGMTLDEPLYIPNCGPAQLELCMAAQCPESSCTWTQGDCPAD